MLQNLKNNKTNSSREGGFLLLELLIAISVFGLALSVLLYAGSIALRFSNSLQKTSQANALLRESIEAVRNFRDNTGWSEDGIGLLSTEGEDYYPYLNDVLNPPRWELVAGTETVGIFTRSVAVEKVSRTNDEIDEIYNSFGDDPDTRKITATVSWEGKTMELSTYFTNWK